MQNSVDTVIAMSRVHIIRRTVRRQILSIIGTFNNAVTLVRNVPNPSLALEILLSQRCTKTTLFNTAARC